MADRSVTVLLRASVSDYIARMSAAGKATQDLAAKVEVAKAKSAAGYRMIGVGAVAMGGAVVAGFGVAAKAAADFDSKMALVQTLLKASPADMARMRVAALSVGQAYGYTAGQVADAQAELAKAGIGVKEQLGGALVGALTLAAAGQTDVATATEIAAAAMTQFQLSGKDVPHIADLLAAGADRALGSVADLGLGLSQAGPQAHQFGISIEDTVGTLAALAQAGQIGERGGTELSQMLLKLSAPSHIAAADLKSLGISVYGASGQFVGLTSLAGQLQDKLGPLTDQLRTQYLTQIFGARAIKAANVLYAEGADGLQVWIDKVNAAGFAQLQASGKLNSLSGDWLKFKAAIGAASIEAGEPAQGPLRTLVQDATKATKAWEGLPGPVKSAAEAVALAGGAATLAGGAALLAIPKWAAMNAALAETSIGAMSATRAMGLLGKTAAVLAAIPIIDFGLDKLPTIGTHSPDVDKMAASLLALGQTGKTTGQLLTAFGPQLKDFSKQAHEALDPSFMDSAFAKIKKIPVLGWGAKIDSFAGSDADLVQVKKNFAALDEGLAQVSQTAGGLDTAKDAWAQLSAQWVASGHDVKDLVQLFPKFAEEIQSQSTATGDASAAAGDLGTQLSTLTQKTKDATKAAQAYSDKLLAAADPLFALNQALVDLHDKQKAASDATAKYGADSKKAHQANLDLAQSMLNVQANATTLAGAVKSGAVSIDNAKAMLHAFIREGGLTKAQAHDILGAFDHLIGKSKELNRQRPHLTVTADTSPAMLAIQGLVSTLTADVGHAWNFLIGTHSATPSRKPGRASGGGAPEGFFAVGEQGPELAFKDGSNVHIFSNSASRAMVGATGMSVPGFAGGTTASQRYENRLRSIVSDRGASPHDVRRAVEALTDLSAEWDATLRRIGNSQQLRQLKGAVSNAKTPDERNQAEKQLAQFRRQRDQDAATRRIQAAQDLATNRQTWTFERMSVKEQISYLDKAMDKEKRFSDQWLQDAEQRRSLRQSQKQDLAGNKAQWQFENMSAQQQIAFLDKKIAKEKKYSDQWLADMEQRKSLQESLANNTATTGTVVNNPINQPGTIPDLARYASGGPVAGYGSGTSDSIYSRLSNGEYVEPAAATAKYGPELSAMRAGTYVPAQGGGGDIHVHVTMSGPVAGDWQALGKKIAEPVYQELRRHARTRGPVTF